MTRYGNLLDAVAKDLSIKQGNTESTVSYATRLVYSAVGRLMLAALHDRIEREPGDEDMVSVKHLTDKGKDILRAYIKMYPNFLPIENADQLIDYFYDVYAASGHLYHTAYYVAPAAYKNVVSQGVSLCRGISLHLPVCMSGLGLWQRTEEADTPTSVQEMFCLSDLTLEQQWNHLLSLAKWEKSELSDGLQYLNTQSFWKGYWLDQPEKNAQISVARIGLPGARTFFLYRTKHNTLFLSQIPSWRIEEIGVPVRPPAKQGSDTNKRSKPRQLGQYLIMNACLCANGSLPPIHIRNDGSIVHLQIGYIPPTAENALLHLYSWPVSYSDIPDSFSRIMSTEVYYALKPIYEAIGFQFQEESS